MFVQILNRSLWFEIKNTEYISFFYEVDSRIFLSNKKVIRLTESVKGEVRMLL